MTPEQINELIALRKQIFWYFLEVSNERGYATPESCVSYLNSTIPAWAAEAAVFNVWRDNVYVILNVIETQAQRSGIIPTFDKVVAQLPVIVWPI